MLIDGFVIGIIVAVFRGGKLRDLFEAKLKRIWLIVFAFCVQYAIIVLNQSFLLPAVIISYGALLAFACFNQRQPGFHFILAGIAMNLLVMAANDGRMPVDVGIVRQYAPDGVSALLAGQSGKHIAMSEQTHLNLLGDIFYLHAPYPREGLVSLGDIVFSIGVFLWIQKVMVRRRSPKQGSVDHGVSQNNFG
ncbi:DUF5317 domain-containing protein [Effusibacillus pohliae]|uniref:DUF5317 domain-containing protein n=1 Tax=Effusibacillus pohliae TaxID=232270 RepID=UPI0003772D7D|nr:DUF5317 domain-containing protein [Effusibacillus pohliae]